MAKDIGLGRPAGTSSRASRQSSGAFSSFDQAQIAQFRETFAIIDTDSDGLISEGDIRATLTQLGKQPTAANVAPYFERSPTINFALFLQIFAEQLLQFDDDAELRANFEALETDVGLIEVEQLRKALGDSADALLVPPFLRERGRFFDYRAFLNEIRVFDQSEQK